MSGDLTFAIRIGANGQQAAQEIERVRAALKGTNAEIVSTGQAASRSSNEIAGATGALSRYAAAFAGVISVGQVLKSADEWGQLASRIDIAAGSTREAEEATARLMEVSNRSYKSFANSAELYVRTNQSLKELGYSANNAMDMVSALQYGLTVSAASGEKAANVIAAWSKSINQGKMKFLEFQTVLNGSPRLVQALAESLGVTTVELQAMVHDGKITADMLVGIGSQFKKLGEEADKMPVTIADAFTRFQNNLSQFAGSAEKNTGVIKAMTDTITALGDNIDIVMAVVGTAAVAAFGRFVAAAVAKTAATVAATRATQAAAVAEAELQLAQARSAVVAAAAAGNTTALTAARVSETAATVALTAAQRGATLASGAASLASRAAGVAMGALGGPVGLAITVLGGLALAWTTMSNRAKESAAEAEKASQRLTDQLIYQRQRLAGLSDAEIERRKNIRDLEKAVDDLDSKWRRAVINAGRGWMAREGSQEEADAAVEALKGKLDLQKQILANQKEADAHGGVGKFAYATGYLDERLSDAQKREKEIETENEAFEKAINSTEKNTARYEAVIEAHHRTMDAINKKWDKKEARENKTPKTKEESLKEYDTYLSAGAERPAGEAYGKAMEKLIALETAAKTEGQNLTDAQKALLTVMSDPLWERMSDPMKEVIRAGAQAADQAKATAAYNTAMTGMQGAINDAAKSTMDLDEAMTILYDLMLSPAWSLMSDEERKAAVVRAESASQTIKEIELEREFQDVLKQTPGAVRERNAALLARIDQGVANGELSQKDANDAKKAINEQSKYTQNQFASSIARGIMDGFSSGKNFAKSLGDTLMSALNSSAEKGLSEGIAKALNVASGWIAELFKSLSSGSNGDGGWISSLVSAIGSWAASAQGNAFTGQGMVQAFATGGAFGRGEILTRPTAFRFASGGAFRTGIAGEAGPEAALPLKRMSNGNLGVAFEGGGGVNVSVQINVNSDGSRDEKSAGDNAKWTDLAWRIGRAAAREVITDQLRDGGALSRARG